MSPVTRLAALALLAALVCALPLGACAAGGATKPVTPAAGANAPAAVQSFWPEGVPTPPPMRAAPEVGPSENGADKLKIDYEPPHLKFTLIGAPDGGYSVIYIVASARYKADKLQIDSVDPDSNFKAMLEYDRLAPGEYLVRAFAKGVAEPLDSRTIQVPD